MPKKPDFLTVPELAHKLGLSYNGASRSLARYGIPFTRIGPMRIVAMADVRELMRLRAGNVLSLAQRKRRNRERG